MSHPGNGELEELRMDRAIRRLIASYSRYADREKFVRAAAFYAMDAELVVAGQAIHGRPAIFEWFQSAIKAAARALGIHFTSNTVLERARGVWEGTTDFVYIRGEAEQLKSLRWVATWIASGRKRGMTGASDGKLAGALRVARSATDRCGD